MIPMLKSSLRQGNIYVSNLKSIVMFTMFAVVGLFIVYAVLAIGDNGATTQYYISETVAELPENDSVLVSDTVSQNY